MCLSAITLQGADRPTPLWRPSNIDLSTFNEHGRALLESFQRHQAEDAVFRMESEELYLTMDAPNIIQKFEKVVCIYEKEKLSKEK